MNPYYNEKFDTNPDATQGALSFTSTAQLACTGALAQRTLIGSLNVRFSGSIYRE